MISPQQVTALLAQLNVAVDVYPAFDSINVLLPGWSYNLNGVPVYVGPELGTRGVGLYGQSVSSLVLTGYVKSAALNLILDHSLVSTVLNSPAVWSGLNGVGSLIEYLSNEDLQTQAQIDLMQGAYQGLLAAGVLTGNQGASFEATFVLPASRYGVDLVIAWINGQVDTATDITLTAAARQAQYAIDFVGSNSSALISVPVVPGYVNTTVRDTVDQAVTQVIGSDKVPVIDFGGANVANVNIAPTTNEDGTFRFAPGKPQA